MFVGVVALRYKHAVLLTECHNSHKQKKGYYDKTVTSISRLIEHCWTLHVLGQGDAS